MVTIGATFIVKSFNDQIEVSEFFNDMLRSFSGRLPCMRGGLLVESEPLGKWYLVESEPLGMQHPVESEPPGWCHLEESEPLGRRHLMESEPPG